MNRGAVVVLGGAGALALLAVAASSSRPGPPGSSSLPNSTGSSWRPSSPPPRRNRMDWIEKVIARVSGHEGGYESVNRNSDGAGLSFGMLQWAQRTGDLGKLLAAMRAADPDRFAAIFGSASAELLAATAKGSLAPVAGAELWKEPWVGRFRAAGRDDVFRAVQRRMAKEGVHFQGALAAARTLGVATERSMALFFDTAVQQGAGAAKKLAEQLKASATSGGKPVTVDYAALLTAYAERAAGRARRATAPTKQPTTPGLRWAQVGTEWHLFARNLDLYKDIQRRRMGIVRDPKLGDGHVEGVVA